MNPNDNPNARRGGISVETAHIFPVIKKWLYSEKDIFLREIVSNAADAVTKHKRLVSLGEIEDDETDYRIDVTVDKTARTLSVSDNGIGMTEEELLKYLGSIALSGAVDFINKYEGDQKDGNSTGIIGHFGLGFYSAFMVADDVEVVTKSCTGAPALRWICHADGSYDLYPADRDSHGTTVIMHVSDEEEAYLESYKVKEMLDKYCSFMPTEIYFTDADKDEETDETSDEASDETPDGGETEKKEPEAPKPVNDIHPLWQKAPSECTPEEYKEFYRKVFHDYREPLFWIHINADYPLNFKGILYFPKLSNEYESIEGQVKLYYNQVFVADNIKEVIPEYLLMLKGVLDCPELPLNVSRSYLQNNTYVSKVSAHIVKKVSDKLNSLCDTQREEYEKVWDSIKTFVEYACMRD
ncbi:MAG: molecular chaperone HtpG, partial [Clostridia bacterium]|nr:molecular chaperone HtpG [Clostridia bacterium]